jgi:hypothetical protein
MESTPGAGRAPRTSRTTGQRAGLLSIDRVWILLAVAIPTLGSLALSMSTVDLTYHIRLGEQILHGTLPRMDTFTFSAPGATWTDQQWLAQALLALAHRIDGWNAIVVLRALLTAVAFAFVFAACRRSGASVRASAGLTVASAVLSSQNIGMRPQLFAVPLFAATLWISATRREHPARQWAIPVLVAVWANVHGSFVLGPILVGFDWLEDRRERSPRAGQTFLVGLVAAAATLLNPFGLRVWTYTLEVGTNPTVTRFASEWEPTTIRSFSGAALFVSVIAVMWLLSRRREPVPWPSVLRLTFFFFLALPAVRGIVWWGLAAPVAVAGWLAPPRTAEGGRVDRQGSPVINLAVVLTIGAAAVLALPWWRTPKPGGSSPLLNHAPEGVAVAIETASAPGDHVWVDQVWASWLEYRLPDRPVFVDSRIELYRQAVWTDYLDAANGREGWQAILDRWNVDVVALSPGQSGELLERIAFDPGWQRTYRDDDGSVYIRKASP